MRIIVGLGNPEDKYKGTRHNVGFETINKLAYDFNINVKKSRFRAHIGEGMIGRTSVLLVKPQTYMNLSGESVRAVLQFYKIPPSEMIVLYDDVNLPVGDVRVREKGGAGGHNGMRNIIDQLKTEDFPRVRIGISAKPPGWDLADYVLSRFPKEEWDAMINGVTQAGDAVSLILRDGVAGAMNRYNKRLSKPKTEKTAAVTNPEKNTEKPAEVLSAPNSDGKTAEKSAETPHIAEFPADGGNL